MGHEPLLGRDLFATRPHMSGMCTLERLGYAAMWYIQVLSLREFLLPGLETFSLLSHSVKMKYHTKMKCYARNYFPPQFLDMPLCMSPKEGIFLKCTLEGF